MIQSQALLFYVTGWDVTNEVLDLMNQRVTQVEVQPPTVEPDQPAAAAPAEQPKAAKSKDKDKPQQQQ